MLNNSLLSPPEKVLAKKSSFFFDTISISIMRNIHYIGNTQIVYSAFPDKMKAIFEGLEILPLCRVDSYYNFFWK